VPVEAGGEIDASVGSTAPLHSRAVRGDELNCRSRILSRLQTCNTAHANYKQTEPQSDPVLITLLFSKIRMFRILLFARIAVRASLKASQEFVLD
jgi:hypothetical protein